MKKLMAILGCVLVHSAVFGAPAIITITRCTVTAGRGTPSDSITISGTTNIAENFNTAATAKVEINSSTIQVPISVSFDVNESTFKRGRFRETVKGFQHTNLSVIRKTTSSLSPPKK